MVNIGGDSSGFRRLSERRERPTIWAVLTQGVLVAALVVTATTSASAAGSPGLGSKVATANGGGGAALTGPNISSIETFAAGTKNKQAPLFFDQGTETDLFNPTDIKFSPLGLFLAVANTAAGVGGVPPVAGTLIFSANANGNTGPLQVLQTPLTDQTQGVAFDAEGDLWVSNLLPAHCLETAAKDCTPTSPDFCGLGSLQEFVPTGLEPSPFNTVPVRTILPCGLVDPAVPADGSVVSDLIGPIGMFVDETSVEVCVPSGSPSGACAAVGGVPADLIENPVFTHRVWVVDNLAGAVTVYEPELAEAIGNQIGTGGGLITDDFTAQAPIGGTFSTAAFAGDKTSPQYIASGLVLLTPDVYLTDILGGFKGRGRIKEFSTTAAPAFCAQPFGETDPADCDVFVLDSFLTGTFEGSIEGSKTKLDQPEGIGSVADTIYVTNTLSWTIEQFAPDSFAIDGANIKPEVIVRGPTNKKSKQRMIAPFGLAVPFPTPTAVPTDTATAK